MGYRNRYVEDELDGRLKRAGAVLIRGPKGCGKTETARYFAKSETVIDASPNTKNIMTLDPKLLLAGDTPHLLDEWQEQPDGTWAAFEIKLGFGAAEEGIRSLLKFLENVDTEKVGKPQAMAVLTGSGVAATHESGVHIVPLSALCA